MDTMPGSEGATDRGTVLILIKDVFFSVAVRNTVRALGFQSELVKSPDAFASSISTLEPVLGVVDVQAIDDPDDWDCITEVIERDVPVLAFGPHKHVEGLRAAKLAGVTRVVSNGQFHAEMGALLERYARTCAEPAPTLSDGDDDILTTGNLPPGMTAAYSQPFSGEVTGRA